MPRERRSSTFCKEKAISEKKVLRPSNRLIRNSRIPRYSFRVFVVLPIDLPKYLTIMTWYTHNNMI